MFLISLSAAPVRTVIYFLLSFFQDLLLPLGLVYVLCAVRTTVVGVSSPSVLFSGKEHSSIIISPVSSPFEEHSSGTFLAESMEGVSDSSSSTITLTSTSTYSENINIIDVSTERTASDHVSTTSNVHEADIKMLSNDGNEIKSKIEAKINIIEDDTNNFNFKNNFKENFNVDQFEEKNGGNKIFEKFENFEKFEMNPTLLTAFKLNLKKFNLEEIIVNFKDKITNFCTVYGISENFFTKIISTLKHTFTEILKLPSVCILLGAIFISVILCGVILPGIKENIGEKMINYLHRKVHRKKILESKTFNKNIKNINNEKHGIENINGENNGKNEEDGDYTYDTENDDEEEEYYENDDENDNNNRLMAFRKKLNFIIKKMKKSFFSPQKKFRAKKIIEKDFETELADEILISRKNKNYGNGINTNMGYNGNRSKSVLLSPVNLLSSTVSIFLLIIYFLFYSLFISLLSISNELKLLLLLPYLVTTFFTVFEFYIYQPKNTDLNSFNSDSLNYDNSESGNNKKNIGNLPKNIEDDKE